MRKWITDQHLTKKGHEEMMRKESICQPKSLQESEM